MRTICFVVLLVSAVVCSSSSPVEVQACGKYCEYVNSIGTTHELPVFMCDCWQRHRDAVEMFDGAVVVIPRQAVQAPAPLPTPYIAADLASPLEGPFPQISDIEDTAIAYPVLFESDIADLPVAHAEFVTRRISASRVKPKAFKSLRNLKAYRRDTDLSSAMRSLTIHQNTTPPPTDR